MTATLILIHGWGFGPAVWDSLAASLPGIDIRTPALPGYDSAPVGSIVETADWLPGWSAALPSESVVIGWSLGAVIALQLARQYPDRVRALGLIAGLPCFLRQPGWTAGWTPAALAAVHRRLLEDATGARRYVAALAARGDTRARLVRESLLKTTAPPVSVLQAGLDYLAQADERAGLAALEIRVTVWLGGNDQLIGADCSAAVKALQPRAQVRELAGAGHVPFISQSGILAGEIEALL